MKKVSMFLATMACLILTACGGLMTGGSTTTTSAGNGSLLGGLLGALTNGEALGNVITSVIGLDKVTAAQLVGTWSYDGPGCAFTSENLLARAGGEVAATQIEEKMKTVYDKVGFSRSNTAIAFAQDGTFQAVIAGKNWNGTWAFNEQTDQLQLKGLVLTINGYAKRNGTGISILFESKKLLTIIQTMAALSGNANLQTIGDLSKSYDGVRMGFDMSR